MFVLEDTCEPQCVHVVRLERDSQNMQLHVQVNLQKRLILEPFRWQKT